MSKLEEYIDKYVKSEPAKFHMPGHKGTLWQYDVTELGFTDNLHAPSGGIKAIEDKCADVYGVSEAFLLVNGATCGVCAACVAAALNVSERPLRLMIGRDCHRSVLSGAVLAGAKVCGVYPENEQGGVVTAQIIDDALRQFGTDDMPDAVVITSPNYFGMCADISGIANIVHDAGALLIVDSAHGAHFPFSSKLPKPCANHADLCVVSTHKTLSALNQSAILLMNTEKISTHNIRTALSMLQTTSPSYPIMLSIEKAISGDCESWTEHCNRVIEFENKLHSHGISTYSKVKSAKERDITRLCISTENLCANGYELDICLRERGIYMEMADLDCVVAITSPIDPDDWYTRLEDALVEIKQCYRGNHTMSFHAVPSLDFVAEYVDVRRAAFSNGEEVRINDAVGRVSKSAVGVYPPGSSAVLPGETLTKKTIDGLLMMQKAGGVIFGVTEHNGEFWLEVEE